MNREQKLADVFLVYRQAHGLSQAALASILGVDQSYISKIERGHRHINDIQFLKRVSDRLGLQPFQIGLSLEAFSGNADREILQCSNSIITLAETARNSGHPEKAIQELRPLLIRLLAQARVNPGDILILKMIAQLRTILGTALGDMLPQERLDEASKELVTALEITEHIQKAESRRSPARPDLLKKLGNELRKQGAYRSAGDFLARSLVLNEDTANRGSAALCLARLRANQRDRRGFLSAMRIAFNCLDTVSNFSPTFNPVALHEVKLRGSLQLGRLSEAQIEAVSGQIAIGLAPHWSIIRAVTIAEAWLSIGNVSAAAVHAEQAIDGALLCKLPRQISRIFDAFKDATNPTSRRIADKAARAIDKLCPFTQMVWPASEIEELISSREIT